MSDGQSRCLVQPYLKNPSEVMFVWSTNMSTGIVASPEQERQGKFDYTYNKYLKGETCEYERSAGDRCIDIKTGVCNKPEQIPFQVENGWCQMLCKDDVSNRWLIDGIEFNHTKLHAPAEGFAAIMSLMFLGAFGLVLVVTKGFKGWAHDRELLTPAKIVSPYQPSPKKQRTAQHETIIVKHKAAPATVARPGQRYKQQTPGNSALTLKARHDA
jgi:hypothetical protein